MDTLTFWNTYVGGSSPAEFVWRYGKGDPDAAVCAYMQQRPNFLGIVRRDTWKATFSVAEQHGTYRVSAALTAHLEEHREEWLEQVEALRMEERKKLAEARARAEAEALAAAVARVEAEARARALAEMAAAADVANQQEVVGETLRTEAGSLSSVLIEGESPPEGALDVSATPEPSEPPEHSEETPDNTDIP